MSDANLRALERRWRESGSVADEAAWLTARSRTGDLARERLELAVYCGHAAAVLAVGEEEACSIAARAASAVAVMRVVLGEPLRDAQDLRAWLRGLVRWGDEACARAVLASLDVAWMYYQPRYGSGPWTYVAPARAWLHEGRTPDAHEREQALRAPKELARVEIGDGVEDALYRTTWVLARSLLVGRFNRTTMSALGVALQQTSVALERVRASVCAALVAWSLERAP